MPGAIATAFVEVRPETAKFGSALEAETGPAAEKVGRSIGSTIGNAIVAVGIGRKLAESLGEADEARDIMAQTEAVIRSTGGAANVTADQVAALSGRLSDQIAVDDDLIQQNANLLATFTNVRNEAGAGNDIFDQSVAIFQDMKAANPAADMNALGRALNDPTKGLAALTRVGVTFTDQQREQVRALQASGDIMGAQRIILGELATEFGGSAAAQASGLDRITVASGNLKESLGGALLPTVDLLVPIVQGAVGAFENLPAPMQTVIALGGGVVGVLGPAGRAIEGLRSVTSVFKMADAVEGASNVGKLSGALGTLGPAAVGVTALTAVMMAHSRSEERARQIADDYTAAIKDQTGALEDNVDAVTARRIADTGLVDSVESAGGSMETFGRIIRDSGADLADFVSAGSDIASLGGDIELGLQRAHLAATPLGEELIRLADAGELNGSTYAGLVHTLDDLQTGYRTAQQGSENLEGAQHALGVTTEEEAAASDEAAASAEVLAKRHEELIEVINRKTEAVENSLGAELSLEEAMLRSADALDEYNGVLADSAATGRDRQQAGIDLLQTYLAEGESARTAAEIQATASGRASSATHEGVQAQIDALNRLADTLGPEDPLRAQLAEYIATLARIPSKVDTFVSTHYSVTGGGGSAIPSAAGGPRAFARGGRPGVGELGLFGEEGPELWVPDAAGTVVSNDKLRAAVGRPGPLVHVEHMHMSDGIDFDLLGKRMAFQLMGL